MISLILTTLNEARNLPQFFNGVLAQTRRPDEVVVVDGGSKDASRTVIAEYQPRLNAAGISFHFVEKPGANIAAGRNIAIGAAQGPIIAVTDAGCSLDPRWLEHLVEPLTAGRADLVGGFYRAVTHNRLQFCLARLTVGEGPGKGFLPSSRSVAFQKHVWEAAGGYPEWLPWGEDTYFDERMLECGARYEIAANALVGWEVRSTLRAVWRQFYRYAYGDGLAGRRTRSLLIGPCLFGITFVGLGIVGPIALLLPFAWPLSWLIRRRGWTFSDFPVAYAVAGAIQVARTIGYVHGLWARALSASPRATAS
jgi:glycosyltransferase involved in cell wall biosynthesis